MTPFGCETSGDHTGPGSAWGSPSTGASGAGVRRHPRMPPPAPVRCSTTPPTWTRSSTTAQPSRRHATGSSPSTRPVSTRATIAVLAPRTRSVPARPRRTVRGPRGSPERHRRRPRSGDRRDAHPARRPDPDRRAGRERRVVLHPDRWPGVGAVRGRRRHRCGVPRRASAALVGPRASAVPDRLAAPARGVARDARPSRGGHPPLLRGVLRPDPAVRATPRRHGARVGRWPHRRRPRRRADRPRARAGTGRPTRWQRTAPGRAAGDRRVPRRHLPAADAGRPVARTPAGARPRPRPRPRPRRARPPARRS